MNTCWAQKKNARPSALGVVHYLTLDWTQSTQSLIKTLQPKPEVDLLLLPQPSLNHFISWLKGSPMLAWDMLLSPNQLHIHCTRSYHVWTERQYSQAMWPPVRAIKIVSRHFPWDFNRAKTLGIVSPRQEEPLQYDWLGQCTMFGGLLVEEDPGNKSWNREKDNQPYIFQLRCLQ